jgi:hypothetical protein
VEKFDRELLSIAQECEGGGVPEMLDIIFSFLARKTDFYSGSGTESAAENLLLEKFRKHGDTAREEKVLKNAGNAEMDRKTLERPAKAELSAGAAGGDSDSEKMREVADEEETGIETEKETSTATTTTEGEQAAKKEEETEEEDEEYKGKMEPNARNGADLPLYS